MREFERVPQLDQQKGNKMKTVKVPKKIGRPRVHKHVMTPAERQQRWRDKVKRDADHLLKLTTSIVATKETK